ncbi:MAG: hypothetical protein KF884_08205 [Fimbriimonadaceae bacterium]|nr:hypothetical protein [Fimbriimonadaceae bacterium]QYK57532.1 MAG: hypothetical protein KF884_08205 [Fimbriimonadaceae bacterium]
MKLSVRTLALAALFALAVPSMAAENLWRISVAAPDPVTLDRLIDTDVNILDCHPHLGSVKAAATQDEAVRLQLQGFKVTYLNPIPDTKNWARFFEHVPANYRTTYYNADQILAHFEALRVQYPSFVTRAQIGTSILNEPIWVYRVGRPLKIGGTPENSIIVLGLQHAREWVTGSIVMHVGTMAAQTLATPQAVPFMLNQALYIVPITNPDGYRFTWTNNRLWRKNRRNNGNNTFGVDLNRNWAKGWGGSGSSGNTNSETYRGTAAFSEPETRALRDFSNGLPRVGGFLDIHSYSQLVMWPWGYSTTTPPKNDYLRTGGQRMEVEMDKFGANYTSGQIATLLYVASGCSVDWVFDIRQSACYTYEMRDEGQFGFELPPSQIAVSQDEGWAGVKELLKYAGP